MKIVKISNRFFQKFPSKDYELLLNEDENGVQRPYVVLIKLTYKGFNIYKCF